jgi:hypothetical protein
VRGMGGKVEATCGASEGAEAAFGIDVGTGAVRGMATVSKVPAATEQG